MASIKTTLSATLCLLGLTLGKAALAIPAAPFTPILQDLTAQLPDNMVMRLPTQAAMDGIQGTQHHTTVDPYIDGELRINIHSEPNCTQRFCQLGYFSTTAPGITHPMETYAEEHEIGRARITLADGIVGHYITVVGARQPFSIVLWAQDQQTYVVSVPPKYDGTPADARQRILDFAISMANEPAITSE